MMSSHGVGRYDSGDVWFTSQLLTQKQKKEKTIEKTIYNYKELGIKGTLQLSGVKLREVWLTGDDDFTKMSYVSTDYGTANEFLNGKHNGWILMYSYLMRMAVWCFALVAAIGMLRKRNPWNYVVMLTLLGGMIFHVFWEANPKYSICFMGVMMFMMVTGIENLCEEEKKEQKQKISMGNVMLCLVGIGLIVCLQPMHNYLKQNPEALDQSYAASQFAQSQTLNLFIKVDYDSHTSMKHLYAIGETACNGVHGKNRLASNSLLESLVFAKRAAKRIEKSLKERNHYMFDQTTLKLNVDPLIISALKEDITSEDVSTNSVMPFSKTGVVDLICKEDGIICGLQIFERTFELLDEACDVEFFASDGDHVEKGQLLGRVKGDVRVLLSGERVALNYLQRMSGIATYTANVQEYLKDSSIRLLDTRKTTPNNRIFEKYAVRVGGGHNHRYNLSDGVLLKDNHIGVTVYY